MATRTLRSAQLPLSLQRPVALSSSGGLRFWATVYEITSLSHIKESTTALNLHAIDALYRHVHERTGEDGLDRLLNELDVDELVDALDAYFLKLRNLSVQTGSNNRDQWRSVANFVETSLNQISSDEKAATAVRRGLRRLQIKLDNLQPNPKRSRTNVIRALPSIVLSEVYDIFDPASSRNPFRGETQRWRNHCLLLSMLHQGLRRGEALLLPANDVKEGMDDTTLRTRHWMNVQNLFDEEDPRFSNRPSIKNVQSVRQIPVSAGMAARFQHFVDEHRGRSPYPQLFLNSSGTPLGTRSVGNIMAAASRALSDAAKESLIDNMREPSFTGHDLRHTCAVVRLFHYRSAAVPEEEALQKLRAFFGWTYDSLMPRRYARAYYERHVAEVWNDDFDAHVDAIRTIEHTIERS